MEIRLDKETFRALSSSTRIDVLKLLLQRRYMQSEIASHLNLSVPTVKEHLSALLRAGLVEKHEEGRKWKYYSLTKKGHGVLHPEEMKIWIVLGLFCFSVVCNILTYLNTFSGATAEKAMLRADIQMLAAEEAVQPAVNYWPAIFGVAAIVFAVLLIYLVVRAYYYKKMLRQIPYQKIRYI